jgi:hypothetical protein
MAPGNDHQAEIKQLQLTLSALDGRYEVQRQARNHTQEQWDAFEAEAAVLRTRLFKLTGGSYGRAHVKMVSPRSVKELEAPYNSADQIAPKVRNWNAQNACLLTTDVSDAVRLMRIVDTLMDDR